MIPVMLLARVSFRLVQVCSMRDGEGGPGAMLHLSKTGWSAIKEEVSLNVEIRSLALLNLD